MTEYVIGDNVVIDFTLSNPRTGNVSDADSLPTCEIFESDDDVAILTPTVVKRTGKTGNYRVTIPATAANGFEVDKVYNAVATATVGGITAKGVIETFTLTSESLEDLLGRAKFVV